MYAQSLEDDDDRNVLVEKIVPHVYLAESHENVGFGFSLMGGTDQTSQLTTAANYREFSTL